MSRIITKNKTFIIKPFLLYIFFCIGEKNFAQSGFQPIKVVKSADRVPLYPFNDHSDNKNFVYPSVIPKSGSLTVFTSRQFDILEMISGNGTLVFQQNISGRTGRFDIPLKSGGSTGINYVRLRNKEIVLIQKVIIVE